MRTSRAFRGIFEEFNCAHRIVPTHVGPKKRFEIPSLLAAVGAARPLLVTDAGFASQTIFQTFVSDLKKTGTTASVFTGVHPNPLSTDVERGLEAYHKVGADSLVCIGGGSALDAGKCIAYCAESGLSLRDLDFWKSSGPISMLMPSGGRMVPCITVPTTAGTGAEMSNGAVLTDTTNMVKFCAGHKDFQPTAAVLDPEFCLSLPPNLTAWTGADALVHAIEAYLVKTDNPQCDAVALRAMQKIQRSLLDAYADGSNVGARTEMLVASSMAAVSFKKGLGAVHGLSEPLGAVYNAHHGLANGVLLPYVLRDLGASINEACGRIVEALRLPIGK